MSLTRAMLKGMGLTEEQVGAIIDEHTGVTDALKTKIKDLEANSGKVAELEKELDALRKDAKDNDWKGKYEKEHGDFEAYKKDVSAKELAEKTKSAYKKLLAECKIGNDFVNSILNVTDFSKMKLNEDGSLVEANALKKAIETDYSGFVITKETKPSGAPETPPDNTGAKGSSRASEIAREYYENKYGKAKED